MTKAGNRILNRKTVVIHMSTGITVSIDNTDIPVDEQQRTHLQQRDAALSILSKQMGFEVPWRQCSFEFSIINMRDEI